MLKRLSCLLAISIGCNVYLFFQVIGWQKAWLEQFLTTSTIEQIYRSSSADTSFNSINAIVEEQFPDSYKLVPVTEVETKFFEIGPNVIYIDGTKLFFSKSQYIGSKADLPDLEYWWFNR